jgi:hypothetical protein
MKYPEVELHVDRKSSKEVSSTLDGLKVSIALGSAAIRVHDVVAENDTHAENMARTAANKFLDMLAVRYGYFATLRENSLCFNVPQAGPGEVSKRIVIREHATLVETLEVRQLAADGTVLHDSARPGHVESAHISAMSYFRRAGVSTDVFESLRNYFLAAENASSIIAPEVAEKARSDKATLLEGIKRAYGVNDASLIESVRGVAPPETTVSTLDDAAGELYRRYRCALNHAKECRDKLIPFSREDELVVGAAVPVMMGVARKLINTAGLLEDPAVSGT